MIKIISVKEVPAPKNKAKAVRIKALSRCKSADDNMYKLNIEVIRSLIYLQTL